MKDFQPECVAFWPLKRTRVGWKDKSLFSFWESAMFTLPKINTYGEYSGGNYGAHCLVVEVGPLTVWFSYRTPVAFQVDGHARVVHENDWGPTTGKHLNWIDSCRTKAERRSRVSDENFNRLWNEQVAPLLGNNPASIFEAAMA
jgi:hypothetical protein